MKFSHLLCTFAYAAVAAQAKDIVTLTGSIYRNCTELRAVGTDLWFKFDGSNARGNGVIPYASLPSTLRAQYFPQLMAASSSVTKAGALTPIAVSHLGLEAQMFQNSAKARDFFKTDYGSGDVRTEKSRAVGASVRNFGSTPAKAEIVVHWIGKLTATNVRTLLKTERQKITLAPGGTGIIVSDSGTVKGSDLNLVMIGYRRTEGERIEGWAVMLYDDSEGASRGKLIGVKASDTHLAELVRKEGGLAALEAVSKREK